MFNPSNKVIWITGASSGIGKALAIVLSKKGAKVVLSARNEETLKETQFECPNETFVLPLDLIAIDTFEAKTKAVIDHFGQIDMLINNGGISQRSLASETPLEIDRKVMEVNYFGNIALAKAVLPYFQQQQSGYFVVISSLSGKFGFFLRSAYAASKHALVGFYESLLLEEEKNNIRVSLVFPGLINTNISKNAINAKGEAHGELDEKMENGISPEKAAADIIAGIEKGKLEITTGGKELAALRVKRLSPSLFHKIIKKQKPT